MAVCGREAARRGMLRRAAARVEEERPSTNIVRGKRLARLLTKLVYLRIPEEDAAAQVRDMHLSPAAQVRDACSSRRRSETHALVVSYFEDTRRIIDIGSGKYRELLSVRRGMPWPVGLPFMPLEVISVLHLLTCISTRTGRCCFTLLYSCFTPALLLLYI
jgi:hypothetical protein